jgi:hypothetical protein
MSGLGGSRKITPFIVNIDSLNTIVLAHNKSLRKELIQFRNKRDRFLLRRLNLLKPFLASKVRQTVFATLSNRRSTHYTFTTCV